MKKEDEVMKVEEPLPATIQEPKEEKEVVEEKKDNPTTNPNTYLSQGDGVSKPSSAVAKEPEVEQPQKEVIEDIPMEEEVKPKSESEEKEEIEEKIEISPPKSPT
jgi:hypothetical protein